MTYTMTVNRICPMTADSRTERRAEPFETVSHVLRSWQPSNPDLDIRDDWSITWELTMAFGRACAEQLTDELTDAIIEALRSAGDM